MFIVFTVAPTSKGTSHVLGSYFLPLKAIFRRSLPHSFILCYTTQLFCMVVSTSLFHDLQISRDFLSRQGESITEVFHFAVRSATGTWSCLLPNRPIESQYLIPTFPNLNTIVHTAYQSASLQKHPSYFLFLPDNHLQILADTETLATRGSPPWTTNRGIICESLPASQGLTTVFDRPLFDKVCW
jgi:hypothetical protein